MVASDIRVPETSVGSKPSVEIMGGILGREDGCLGRTIQNS